MQAWWDGDIHKEYIKILIYFEYQPLFEKIELYTGAD